MLDTAETNYLLQITVLFNQPTVSAPVPTVYFVPNIAKIIFRVNLSLKGGILNIAKLGPLAKPLNSYLRPLM
jgi:hypothetical protein